MKKNSHHYPPLAWPLRLIALILATIQTALALNAGQVVYDKLLLNTVNSDTTREGAVAIWQPPAAQAKSSGVVVMAKEDPLTLRALLGLNPSDSDIMAVKLFSERLLPSRQTTAFENKTIAQALISFSERKENDDMSSLINFLGQNPASPWKASLLVGLGDFYRQSGYFSRAISVWHETWQMSRNDSFPAATVADQALVRLADIYAALGKREKLDELLQASRGRHLGAGINTMLSDAQNSLELMKASPQNAFWCGPASLMNIRLATGTTVPSPLIEQSQATEKGFNLADLCQLANDSGMKLQMAKRDKGAEVPLPSVIHWKVGHYAAIVEKRDNLYRVQDPVLNGDLWVNSKVFDEEGSGFYLLASTSLPAGWSPVSVSQGQAIWGKGTVGAKDKNRMSQNDKKCGGDPCDHHGMANYTFHTMLVNLNINDTPLGYTPPRGPAVDFTVTYNQQEGQQTFSYFPYSNAGRLWTMNWLSYVQESSASNNVSIYLPGGGMEDYTYDIASGAFVTQPLSRTKLVKMGSGATATYARIFPDGSRQVYAQLDGSQPGFTKRMVFLSQIQDVQGNSVDLVYDNTAQHRLLSIVDALGQQTTFTYLSDAFQNGTNADFYKISKVTDPWNRSASFTYTSPDPTGSDTRQLVTITDVGGLTSQFSYANDSSGFITALTTPYGTTTFNTGYDTNTLTRWLTATDPQGQTERLEFNQTGAYTNAIHELVPPDFQNGSTNYYGYRNSFFWSKRAMAEMGGVITPDSYNSKAVVYHWLHKDNGSPSTASGTLESIKTPLESRVCFVYQGQSNPYIYEGTNDQPVRVERVLDDGTTQTNAYQYNDLGYVTQYVDPSGRITTYNYSTNNIDLLEIRQGSPGQLLATFAYAPNHPHLPQTVTDASGQTTSFSYNDYGQLLTVLNAKNEQTSFAYDGNGYLQSVTGALPGATMSFTYDSAGRVKTITDPTGYSLAYDYDVFDRPTRVTYPDGTFEQTVYKYLNTERSRDRMGRWTDYVFDSLKRVVAIRDALGRTTQFQWCACGSLEAVVDPLQRVTMWNRDIQGRVTSKVYPDGKSDTYVYENRTSRLKTFTDALNKPVSYLYYQDDNLKEILRTNVTQANPSVFFSYDSVYNRVTNIQTVEYNTASYTYNYQSVPTNIPSATTGNGMLASINGRIGIAGNTYTVAYVYDELGRVTGRAIDGVNTSVAYDALGRAVVVTNALGSFTNNYVGVAPRLASVNYPNSQTTSFSYYGNTNDQRLAEIWNQHAGTNLSKFDYTYDANGQIQTWTQQADAAQPQVYTYEYDRVGQLMSAVLKTTGASPIVLKQFAYLYDKSGNRTSEQIGGSSPLATALNGSSYNNLNQKVGQSPGGLLQVKGVLSGMATATVNGNAATVNNDLTFTGYASNTVASASGTSNVVTVVAGYTGGTVTNSYGVIVTGTTNRTLTYDVAGNLLSDGVRTYAWENGVLTGITNGTHVSRFYYDGVGRRIQAIEYDNGTQVQNSVYVWCGSELCEDRVGTGGNSWLLVNWQYFPQGERAPFYSQNYYYTRDHLGSVRELTDSSGNVRARYDYDPYGRRTKVSGDRDAHFGYAGMYHHAYSGLNLTLFRAYAPDSGRWLSRDPAAEDGSGLNLYAYVFNDPINGVDPLGLAFGDYWDTSATMDYYANVQATSESGFARTGAQLGNLLLGFFGISDAQKAGQIYADPCSSFGDKLKITGKLGIDVVGSASIAWRGFGALKAPNELYHFTSGVRGAEISTTGVLNPGAGLFGNGVYVSTSTSATVATLQGAHSTEAVVQVTAQALKQQGLSLVPTWVPGSYRIIGGSVALP